MQDFNWFSTLREQGQGSGAYFVCHRHEKIPLWD